MCGPSDINNTFGNNFTVTGNFIGGSALNAADGLDHNRHRGGISVQRHMAQCRHDLTEQRAGEYHREHGLDEFKHRHRAARCVEWDSMCRRVR